MAEVYTSTNKPTTTATKSATAGTTVVAEGTNRPASGTTVQVSSPSPDASVKGNVATVTTRPTTFGSTQVSSVPSQMQSIDTTPKTATIPSQANTFSSPTVNTGTRTTSLNVNGQNGAPPLADSVNPSDFELTGYDPNTQSAVYHGVPALRETNKMSYGPETQDYSQDTARYGAYERLMNSPDFMASFLQNQYGQIATGPVDVSQYMPTIGGRTQFDYQREQIDAQFAAEMQRQSEHLDAMLASQGITGPAAAQAKTQLMAQMASQRATALQGVNQQEAAFGQEVAVTEAARRFSKETQLTEQAFTSEMTYAQLNQRERELSEQARQFDNRQDYEAWALKQNLTNDERQRIWQSIQNDENRRIDAAGLQQKVDQMRNDLAYQYEQLKTTTGVERDQIRANIYNQMQDIASAERQLAYRSYADQQLAKLNSDLEQNNWEDRNAIEQRQQAFFNIGKAGTIIGDDQLSALKEQDPLAYYAYIDGKAGMDQAVFNSNVNLRLDWLKASIAALSTDLSGTAFSNAVAGLMTQMEELWAPTGVMRNALMSGMSWPSYDPFGTPSASVVTATTGTSATIGGTPGQPVVPTPDQPVVPTPGQYDPNYVAPVGTESFSPPISSWNNIPASRQRVNLFRGTSQTGNWKMNSYTPVYTYDSPESKSFIEAGKQYNPSNPPPTNFDDMYRYDPETQRQSMLNALTNYRAANPVLNPGDAPNLPDMLAWNQSGMTGNLKYEFWANVLAPAGLEVSSTSQYANSGQNYRQELNGTALTKPSFGALQLDLEYMDELAAKGDLAGLYAMAYNSHAESDPAKGGVPATNWPRNYVTIGNTLWILQPTPDWSNPDGGWDHGDNAGVTLVNCMDPKQQIQWKVPEANRTTTPPRW